MRYVAYWINPNGEILPVETHHITNFFHNPQVFGLTRDDVLSSYQKHGERPGIEGKAREELILEVMKRGWIRLRYVPKEQSWTAQLYGFTEQQKGYLFNWCRRIKDGKYGDNIGKLSGFTIIDEKGDVLYSGNFSNYLGE